jgi:hypothetical protein
MDTLAGCLVLWGACYCFLGRKQKSRVTLTVEPWDPSHRKSMSRKPYVELFAA